MRVLVTNDDGIASPGLAVLARVALEAGADEVVVAAPARDASGASASLFGAEQDGRLLVDRTDAPDLPPGVASYAVQASPALIAFVAAHGAFGARPDVVLSGVNRGANTGHAVLHSGTVGAALSAATHGIRSMAVSVAHTNPQHWATAGVYAAHVLDWLVEQPDLVDRAVNLNVPDRPVADVRGLRRAPLAGFGAVQATVEEADEGALQLTYAEVPAPRDADTDAGLLLRGWATVTLVHAPAFDADAALPELTGPLEPPAP
jgi:5'-nucleotidase